MSTNTALFTELNQFLAHIPADSETVAVNSSWVSMSQFHRAVAVISVGDMAATATFDAKLQEATDSDGTSAKDITDKAITQLTQAGGDSNQILVIELDASELDVDNGFDHIRLVATPAVAAVEFAAFIIGFDARYKPVSITAIEEVVE